MLEGVGTKTKAIVPMFLDGEYIGVVGFDSTRQRRSIDSAELSALEMSAGIIGAALHREPTIAAVAGDVADSLRWFAAFCRSGRTPGFTASDFPDASVSAEALQRLVAKFAGR